MTTLSDLEISKALALAIGWKQIYTTVTYDGERKVTICVTPDGHFPEEWHIFDYRDWNVIGPIAEKYNAFPYMFNGTWTTRNEWEYYETPQKAIALAVIGAKK